MKRQTLCLIFGGKSSEHQVSLRSCACILKNINREKYVIHKIGITRDGKWYLYKGDESKIETGEWESAREKYPISLSLTGSELTYGRAYRRRIRPDIIFPVVHGENCEDGRLQGLFDIAGIKYVGCGTEAGVLAMNKHLTKLIAREHGIPIANYITVNSSQLDDTELLKERVEKIGYPVFVKPTSCGSSVGVYKVEGNDTLIASVRKSLRYSDTVLIEETVCGVETEVAVLRQRDEMIVGGVGQIEYSAPFYDYNTKYESDRVRYIIPAEIDDECKEKIEEYARTLFRAIGGRGMCRADFFVTSRGKIVFNEINTMPGFTSGSMYPMLMAGKRGSISGLIDSILVNEI